MTEQRHNLVDTVTGTATTGHEWDGVKELNTPLPRWWLWIFYATIVWSIGYWTVYPSWPLLTGYTEGVFGWQSRNVIVNELAGLRAIRGPPWQRRRRRQGLPQPQ
jgi:cytochrome c oxidase cbb3-type subunit 3